MKNFKITSSLILTALTINLAGCLTEKTSISEDKYTNVKFNHSIEAKELDSIDNRIIKANNSFAFKYLKENIRNTNVVTSPLSLTALLAYLQNGAVGSTKEEILDKLGLSGVEDSVINNSYRDIIAHFNSASGVEIKIGNSVWIANSMKTKEAFKNIGKSYYEADVEEIKFSKKNSGAILNDWVLKHSAGKMISGYALGPLPSNTKMMLFSTLYFRGKWEIPFNKRDTIKANYHLFLSPSDVNLMRQTIDAEYLDGGNFTAVRLPYEDVNYGMYIFLPDYDVNVSNLIEHMNNEKWQEWMQKFTKIQVSISIPKFDMGHGISLNNMLKTFGMQSGFGDTSNFSKISEDPQLLINDLKQKYYININEAGTMVGDEPSENIKQSSEIIDEPIEFEVNRPFAYAVVEKKSGLIIIMGKIELP
jgi:serine protease inhibitor